MHSGQASILLFYGGLLKLEGIKHLSRRWVDADEDLAALEHSHLVHDAQQQCSLWHADARLCFQILQSNEHIRTDSSLGECVTCG